MKFQTKNLLFAALLAAVTAICAQLVIPLPFSQVQFSMVLTAVFLCAGLLGAKYSCISMLVYILLGACGLPVFGRFTGGLGIVLGPTGGYIAAYPLMVLLIGFLTKKSGRRFIPLFLSMLASLVICYVFGSAWLAVSARISLVSALMTGVAPFVIFDVIKAAISAYLCVVISIRMRLGKNSQ